MKTKYIFIIFIFAVTISKITAQQRYSGNYNTINFYGTANYSYIDSDSGRIYDGNFNFSGENNSVFISGKYRNNQKTGKWNFKLINFKYSNLLMSYVISANIDGYFKHSELDGTWHYNKTKTISFAQNGYSQYYQANMNLLSFLLDGETVDFDKKYTVKETSVANFKDNHFFGNFSYNKGEVSIKGQFDKNGYFDGEWILQYVDDRLLKKEIRKYQHGVLFYVKEVNNATGEVSILLDSSEFIQKFFNNYDSLKNISIVNNQVYVLADKDNYSYKSEILTNAINIWFNNKRIENSAYIYEITQGSIPMTIYPEMSVSLDYEKTEEYIQLQEQIKKEQERKRKEKQERLALLEERKTKKINIETENITEFNNLKIQTNKVIEKELKNNQFSNITVEGSISFSCDTNGVQSYDFSNLYCNNNYLLEKIKKEISVLKIPPYSKKGISFYTYAIININSFYYEGKVDFKLNKNKDKKIMFISSAPNGTVQEELEKYFENKTDGKYSVNYKILSINDNIDSEIQITHFKENKHIGRKVLTTIGYTIVITGAIAYSLLTL